MPVTARTIPCAYLAYGMAVGAIVALTILACWLSHSAGPVELGFILALVATIDRQHQAP